MLEYLAQFTQGEGVHGDLGVVFFSEFLELKDTQPQHFTLWYEILVPLEKFSMVFFFSDHSFFHPDSKS